MFRYVRLASNSSPHCPAIGNWVGWTAMIYGTLSLIAWVQAADSGNPSPPTIRAEDVDFFEKRVRPLLVAHCLECHSQGDTPAEGGLRLDSRTGWQAGGELGPPIVPGKPDESLLIEAVEQKSDRLQMPPDNRLSPQEIAILREWIARGAPDPREEATNSDGPVRPAKTAIDPVEGQKFWAYQPVHTSVPRTISSAGKHAADDAAVHRTETPIDLHLMEAWQRNQLQPIPRADRATLIRRVTLDLTGLPPTAAEVAAFINDPRDDAYHRLVDRLMASPRYGERWGRYWLDVARYADSNGLDENIAHGNAWRYRDYVIASWNQDKPFDQFATEQLAGDLMTQPKDESEQHERMIATGFLVLGPKVLAEVDETKMEMDIIDEQVETTGRVFLGLTLGCARCHDHKFDPLSTRDYYALAGIFKSTRTMEHFKKIARWNEVAIASPAEKAAHEAITAKLAEQEANLKQATAELQTLATTTASAGGSSGEAVDSRAHLEQRVAQLKQDVAATKASLFELPTAMAVADQAQPVQLAVHIRGSHLTLGDRVDRRVPEVLQSESFPAPQMPDVSSGRLELAQWLVDPRHPLTARVFVNRLWRWHFGQGLVRSTDNFGQLGERPLHPKLLDWLASELIRNHWSVKHLQRQIVLSHVYQLQSSPPKQAENSAGDPHGMAWQSNEAIDPENENFWRAPMRRLEAESIRDALLAVSGSLDLKMGGSLLHVKNREFLFDHTSKDNTRYDAPVRSVYLPVIRNHLYDMFQLFDYVDDSVTNSDRATTTVAPQALFLMNGELAIEAAQQLARRLKSVEKDAEQRIANGYPMVYGRPATAHERQRDLAYLQRMRETLAQQASSETSSPEDVDQMAWTLLCQIWLASNEFLYVR